MLDIFDNPWLFVSLAAFLLIGAGICRQVRPEWGYWPMLAAVLVAGLGFGLDRLVETDTEQIQDVIATCRRSAMAGTTRGMEPVIADNYFDMAHKSKQSLLNSGNSILSRIAINRIDVRSHTIEVRGSEAQSSLRLRVFMDPRRSDYPLAGGLMFVNMAFAYQKNGEQWQITRVELQSVNDTAMDWRDAR